MVIEINKGESEKEDSLTSTRLFNKLWRCPSIDVNVRSRDCHATNALRAISVWNLILKTKWVCIQLACSWRPLAFEEAHHQDIQAKFYNEKFPLRYESDNIGDSLYEKHGVMLKHKCGKDSNISPSIFFSHFLLGSFWPLFSLFILFYFPFGFSSGLVGDS